MGIRCETAVAVEEAEAADIRDGDCFTASFEESASVVPVFMLMGVSFSVLALDRPWSW